MSSTQKLLKRSGLLTALLALMLAFAAPVASGAAPEEATEWLASELQPAEEGEYCESFSPAGRVGQTIDCMLAFQAAGAAFEAEREAAYEYVLGNLGVYVGTEPCSEASSMSAGAVAKLALGVAAAGDDPMNVGGRDLIADLQCLQKKTGEEKGRFKDKGATDFSNVFGQSLAIIALKACAEGSCASPPSLGTTLTNAASYLRGQQCTENGEEQVDGAFRSAMGLAPGTCENTTPFPSETEFNVDAIDIDSTGFAIEALFAHGSAASLAAAFGAGEWMYGERVETAGPPKRIHWESYCSFSEPTVKLPSVNSTALAIMGASEVGLEATAAREWLADAVASGENRGLPACGATGNGDVLATAQGILGLYGTSYPTLVGL
jgi:hypothetical protein